MNSTATHNRKTVPTTTAELIGELMPTAIRNKTDYESALAMIRRLAVIPALNSDQSRYLDTLCVLVAAYEKEHRTIGRAKRKPLEVIREFVADHQMKVREFGDLLGVTESADSMILKADRSLTV